MLEFVNEDFVGVSAVGVATDIAQPQELLVGLAGRGDVPEELLVVCGDHEELLDIGKLHNLLVFIGALFGGRHAAIGGVEVGVAALLGAVGAVVEVAMGVGVVAVVLVRGGVDGDLEGVVVEGTGLQIIVVEPLLDAVAGAGVGFLMHKFYYLFPIYYMFPILYTPYQSI